MPKTYSNSKKEFWLEQLSQGRTVKQIARNAKCDIRTVKMAIEEIQSRRSAQEALTQLYQEAIRDHMNQLNTVLDRIINELRLPDPHKTAIAWSDINTAGILSNPKTEIVEFENLEDTLSANALLTEHLRNTKAWRAFADWKRNWEKHRVACGQLQIKIIETLSDTTNLAVQVEGNATAPLLYADVAGDLLYRFIVRYLFQEEGALNLEKELVIDDEHGAVKHRGLPLTEGFKDFYELTECRTNIMKSFEILKESQEARQVLNMFQQLEKILPKVRNELRVVRLMGVLPGRCRICHQFGL